MKTDRNAHDRRKIIFVNHHAQRWFNVRTLTAVQYFSGHLVEIKMAVNSISWKMPSKFRFFSAKSNRKVRVRPYLIEFKRLLESSVTAVEGVNEFSSKIYLFKMNRVFVTKDLSYCLQVIWRLFSGLESRSAPCCCSIVWYLPSWDHTWSLVSNSLRKMGKNNSLTERFPRLFTKLFCFRLYQNILLIFKDF